MFVPLEHPAGHGRPAAWPRRDDRERLARDLATHQATAAYACEKLITTVSSLSLVRYRRNDYSVPTSFGHRDVVVRGYVHEVVICCGAEVIARHPRSYEREDFVLAYLDLCRGEAA
jgi:hypothetical protein